MDKGVKILPTYFAEDDPRMTTSILRKTYVVKDDDSPGELIESLDNIGARNDKQLCRDTKWTHRYNYAYLVPAY